MTKREQEMERLRRQIERADEAKARLAKLELEEMKKSYPRLEKFRRAFADLISDGAIDLYTEAQIVDYIRKKFQPVAEKTEQGTQEIYSPTGRNYYVETE